MTKKCAPMRWPLETFVGNLLAIPPLGVAAYLLAIWNVAPWAGLLHGVTTLAIACCGCNVGVILTRENAAAASSQTDRP